LSTRGGGFGSRWVCDRGKECRRHLGSTRVVDTGKDDAIHYDLA